MHWREFVSIGVLGGFCAMLSATLFAQNPSPLPQPALQLLTNGSVRAIAAAPDGSVILGGAFSFVNGVARANIARLQPDGSLDPVWNPGTDGQVFALTRDNSGAIYAGGYFAHIGGQPRVGLAKLSSTGLGAVDTVWDPQASGNVGIFTLAADGNTSVYVGGRFSSIGGQPVANIAKLSSTGTGAADPAWTLSADAVVNVLLLDNNNALYVGGYFGYIGGVNCAYLTKLSLATGATDASWCPLPNASVRTLTKDTTGSLYVGGDFRSFPGQTRNYVAKLAAATGVVDPTWNPAADNTVRSLMWDSSGAIYAGGDFSSIGGQVRTFAARLVASGSGAADPGWAPAVDNSVYAVAVGASATVYVGGLLLVLCYKRRYLVVRFWPQQGHCSSLRAITRARRKRVVAMDHGMWRCMGASPARAEAFG